MMGDALTVEKLIAAADLVKTAPAMPQIVFTPNALEATTERLFPPSKHRSARIRKKLIKRHGGEFRMQPTIWQVGHTIFAHPSYRSRFEQQFTLQQAREIESAIFRGAPAFGFGGGLSDYLSRTPMLREPLIKITGS